MFKEMINVVKEHKLELNLMVRYCCNLWVTFYLTFFNIRVCFKCGYNVKRDLIYTPSCLYNFITCIDLVLQMDFI